MPLPDPHDVCAEITVDVDLLALKVTLPGPVEISLPTFTAPNTQDYVTKLMAQANASLAPLVPIFRVIDVLIALKAFASSVPGVISNPGKVVSALNDLLAKIGGLAAILPQLSVPIMLRSLLDLLIAYVAAIRVQIVALVQVKANIATAQTRATALGSAALQVTIGCAQVSLDAQMAAINAGGDPLNRLIGVINLLGGIVGLPAVPTFDSLGNDPEAALAPLDALSKTLVDLRAAIPG